MGKDWRQLESKLFLHTFKRLPLTLVRGKGACVWDDKGNSYLDFVGGWAVNSLGHCHPEVVKAIKRQAETLIQASNTFYTVPQLQLAELLIKNSCLDRVFFCNSGAEANEGAVKLARRYGKKHLGGAYEVITVTGSFHGRTLAMVAATGQSKFQEQYTPLPEGFVNVAFNDFDALRKSTGTKTCAVMLEPIQGESGVHIADAGYLKSVSEWCRERGFLLILDEVQTGIGRTGTFFAYEQYGVEPDIMTLAKGLGGGVPIGAILAKERVCVFEPGDHGSTFGGNPLVCAAANAVVSTIIRENICHNVTEVGGYLIDRLNTLKREFDCITEVRGRGLLIAVEFSTNIAESITLASLGKGLLVNAVKPNAVRLMPPLTITRQDVERAVEIFSGVLKSEIKVERRPSA